MSEERFLNLINLADDLLSNEDEGDVTFEVGPTWQELKAHKLYLEEKLHSVEKFGQNVVFINDCRPETFKKFLKMIYSNQIHIDSPKRALEFISLANKYSWLELYNDADRYLRSNYTNECSVLIYEHAKRNNDEKLAEQCFSYMIENLEQVLCGEEFLEADLQTLDRLFEDKTTLNFNLTLFINALTEYSKSWMRKTLESKESARLLVEELVKKIPFEKMSSTRFSRLEDLDMLLSKEESLSILKKLLQKSTNVWVDGCVCFSFVNKKETIRLTKNEYKIMCNEDIEINGIVFNHPKCSELVEILTIDSDGASVAIKPVEEFNRYNFKKPLKLWKSRGAKVVIILKNVECNMYESLKGTFNNTTIDLIPFSGELISDVVYAFRFKCEGNDGEKIYCECTKTKKCQPCIRLNKPETFY